MKALFTLKSAISQTSLSALASMLVMVPAIYPNASFITQTSKEKTALVFEVQDPSVLSIKDTSDENQNYLSFDEAVCNDPLTIRLKKYLDKHNSPLAQFSCDIVKQPQWQRALAISWVESNFGRFCADNNCSGIGVAPGHPAWRKYKTKLDWFKDMSALMETPRYKEKYTTFQKMRGIYVYPGTDNWVNGATKKYGELMALTSTAHQDRVIAANNLLEAINLQTFPQLALAK